MTPAEKEAWKIWVNYCCMVKAWYTKDQPEPFGMNPPTEQIADASIAADAELTRLRKAVEYMGNSLNWIESDNGYEMKRPGGGGRSGIILISETLTPWAYINKVMRLREKTQEAG